MMTPRKIAAAIVAHNPDTKVFDHVKVGIAKPLKGSPTGITWRDIQKLAKSVLKQKSV